MMMRTLPYDHLVTVNFIFAYLIIEFLIRDGPHSLSHYAIVKIYSLQVAPICIIKYTNKQIQVLNIVI